MADRKRKDTEGQKALDAEHGAYAGGGSGELTVRICGREKGMEIWENVSFVRVQSKKYNLLIMKDYLPVLGRIEGSVSFRTRESAFERKGVRGFFMHKKNVFSLMLEDVKPEGFREDEEEEA